MLEMDIPSKQAQSCVKKVLRQSGSAQPLSTVVKKAFRLALSMEAPPPHKNDAQEGDLRNLPTDDIYESIREAGVNATSGDDI